MRLSRQIRKEDASRVLVVVLRPRCSGVFCSEKSPIVPQLFCSRWPRQSVFNLCESSVFFLPPHHNMPELSDGDQAPISAACDRTSMKGPNLVVRGQSLYNLPEGGHKGPPSF